MVICDAHCHFFSPRFFETLARERGEGADGAEVTRRLGWDLPASAAELADRWASELDAHHVRRAALIASVPGDEESVAEAVARYPTRFVGMAMTDPTRPGAGERLDGVLANGAVRGVCLFPAMHHFRLDGPEVARVFEIAAGRPGTVVFVHCGILSVGVRKKLGLPSHFDIRLGQPLDLVPVASRHPDVPIIIPHFGAGFFREALMAALVCPNVHFDTSSSNDWVRLYPELGLTGVFRQVLATVGSGRILFGTDSSFFPRGWQRGLCEHQLDLLGDASAHGDDMQKILYGNFERLFPCRSTGAAAA
jgi:predicted TIM-barrel fold metal-dependent hydrolase